MSEASQPMSADDDLSKADRPRRARRPLGFQGPVLLSTGLVGVLGMLEIGLRVAGVAGAPDRTTTWFADHILRPPLWTERVLEDLGTSTMEAGQQHHFRPFTPEKPSDAYRVVVFGGSAAHGYGVLEPGSFPHRLQQLLQRAVPNREIQVINLGTIARSSQQLLWAARRIFEVSDWDLVVVYPDTTSSWSCPRGRPSRRRATIGATPGPFFSISSLRPEAHQVYAVFGQGEPPALPDLEGMPASPEESQELGLSPGLDPIRPLQRCALMTSPPSPARKERASGVLSCAMRLYLPPQRRKDRRARLVSWRTKFPHQPGSK